jgi:hypothetical protein
LAGSRARAIHTHMVARTRGKTFSLLLEPRLKEQGWRE